MTLSSNTKILDVVQFQRTLQIINQTIESLGKFEGNYDKKFNFSELVRRLNIPNTEIDEFIYLLLNFQEKFENVFFNYRLKKKIENGTIYLTVEKREIDSIPIRPPEIITFSPSQVQLLNDIIYTFKHVKRGKGFDVAKNGTKLSSNLKQLRSEHPYLFESKSNGLIYPSPFGLKLGDLIISYNKGNRELTEITIDNHKVLVVNNS
ncbi:hypothetical protein ES703_37755 [subsurface metagenome]